MSGEVYLNDADRVKYLATATELPQRIGKGSMRIVYENLTELKEQLGLSENYDPSCVRILQGAIRSFSACSFEDVQSTSVISLAAAALEAGDLGNSEIISQIPGNVYPPNRLSQAFLSLRNVRYCRWDCIVGPQRSGIAGRTPFPSVGLTSQAGSCLGDHVKALHVKTESPNRDGALCHCIALHAKTESGSLFFIVRNQLGRWKPLGMMVL